VGADAGCSAMRLFGVVGVEGLGYVPTPRIEGDFFLTSLRGDRVWLGEESEYGT
jgi:hypothetical protein